MRKEILLARIGRILILLAIMLSILNIFYWHNNNLVNIISIALAASSLIIVIIVSKAIFSKASPELMVFNEAIGRVQLLNIVYKGVIDHNFEALPLSVEEEVKEKIPVISTDDLLKTYNFILKIPNDLNIYIYKDVLPKNKDLFNSKEKLLKKVENKYPWMDNESLDKTFNYFFKDKVKEIN